MWHRFSNRRGFTLIEMMATAAILGTLSTIALPKFADTIQSNNERNDKQILRRVRLGIEMYYNDNDFFLASISAGGTPSLIAPDFRPYFDTGDHRFPVPKSQLTGTGEPGVVANAFSGTPLTNSNWPTLWGGTSYKWYIYQQTLGTFIFGTTARDKSPAVYGPDGPLPVAQGVPKCVWVSDKDPYRDAR